MEDSVQTDNPVRWGVLGTANIARNNFLPSLRLTGNGVAFAVAGRDPERTRGYAEENGIRHAITGYETLLADERVEAIYVPLPNSLHAEWTIASLRAGKPVFCEKPLATSVAETKEVLAAARETGQPLWEAFVFPFHRQTHRIQELIAAGRLGEVREIHSSFHFEIRSRENIRLNRSLAGGALNDVGCYCVRFADFFFRAAPGSGKAFARLAPEGVDAETQGILSFPDDRRLLFSCGLARRFDTFTRLLGTKGEIRLTSPFHPGPDSSMEIRIGDEVTIEHLGEQEKTFTPALRHVNEVIRGREQPRYLAVDEALATAMGMELARQDAGIPAPSSAA